MVEHLRLKIKDFPADFADRFPDGDYTVGRGADPRGRVATSPAGDGDAGASPTQPPKSNRKRSKKALRPAAE